MSFLYGNHVLKSGLAKITEGAPTNAGVACFAAQGSTLVVGGGAACGEGWRYTGDAALLEEDEREEAKDGAKKRDKPKRMATANGRRMFNRTK